jgi:xylulokinase
MAADCIVALDLGTTAFKAAPVDPNGVRGRVTVAPYALDYAGDGVTCDPERYVRCAQRALQGAARTARQQGLAVRGIGLTSQAQTYIALDAAGKPIQSAIVWTDSRATEEAEEAANALPDFSRTCGFTRPSPLQFLPKVMRFRRSGGQARHLLLLNEWIVYRLTGQMFGDAVNQGMCGFYDISRQTWNDRALSLAGISVENLAAVAPAAALHAPLTTEWRRALDLPAVPVYSCGNDQSCAAVGAGLEQTGDLFCNFGTALVVYALHDRPTAPAHSDQIAGISPIPGRWFLLGVESECGNVVEWLANLLYPRRGVGFMIKDALAADIVPESLAAITPTGSGQLEIRHLLIGSRREEIARALLEYYSERFKALTIGVSDPGASSRRLFTGGGLSRSVDWLQFLRARHGLSLTPTVGEHPGLVGAAKIIALRHAA